MLILLMITLVLTSLIDNYIFAENINGLQLCIPKLGCLNGVNKRGFQTDKYEAFMGIPYANPPVGALRFANPVAADAWIGILNATEPKQDCIQKNYLLPTPFVMGQEDCLYLNVYRPIITSRHPLPVMVYIHGGGFFSGSANPLIHGPEYFMDTQEVILVTLAYRLGALGFLSTGDDNMPGNFGLKDQTLALEWVRKYIRSFGGDPESVTIFGQSAGGVSVHMHMLSPLSEGLFAKAIVLSGNAGAPYNKPLKHPLGQAKKQAELVGIQNISQLTNKQLTQKLREINAEVLVNSGDGFKVMKYWSVDPLTTFRPTVEKNSDGAFITENPSEIIANGNYRHIPWMTGTVPFEGAVRALSIVVNETLRNDFNANFDILLVKLLEFDVKPMKSLQNKLNRIVDFYLNGTHAISEENAQRFSDIITDLAFMYPLYKTVHSYVQYAKTEENPISLYTFSYKGPNSYSSIYTGILNNYGVVHCDDLIYLFRSPLLFSQDFEKNSVDAHVVQAMTETWVDFAKFGVPKAWSPYRKCTKESFISDSGTKSEFCDYQEFQNAPTISDGFEIRTVNSFETNMIRFWDSILE